MAMKHDATAKNCLDILRENEALDVTMKKFGEPESEINAAYRSRDPTKQSQKNGAKHKSFGSKVNYTKPSSNSTYFSKQECRECLWCGGNKHPRDRCPAKESNCNFCQKKGHFQKSCMWKRKISNQNAIQDIQPSSEDEYEQSYDINATTNSTTLKREVLADVKFLTKKPSTLQGKVDTGAMVTCMPENMLHVIGICQKDITPSKARLRGVTGTDMKTLGEIKVLVHCNNPYPYPYFSQCQEAHKAWTSFLHLGRFEAAWRAVFQEFQPALFLSTSTIRLQVVFGRPLFLLPSGVHPKATAQSFVGSFRST